MITTHTLGYPRIGKQRELKFALEKYWQGESPAEELTSTSAALRASQWDAQRRLSWQTVGDFSLYDHVLDTSFLFSNVPTRVKAIDNELDAYFAAARGQSNHASSCCQVNAAQMTKWFDTNYHYLVPEFQADTRFSLNSEALLKQIREAANSGHKAKPVIVGPLTYLFLGKAKDHSNKLALLPDLLQAYKALFSQLEQENLTWVQLDEPILVTELSNAWQQAFRSAYASLASSNIKILLTTYFGSLGDNLSLVASLPVAGIHLDVINAREELPALIAQSPKARIFSVGVINGRNVWKTNLATTLDWLEPLYENLGDRLWLAPSCSLLHVPVDLCSEKALCPEIKNWLAFAEQKLQELDILACALSQGRASVAAELAANAAAIKQRQTSARVHKPEVQSRLQAITACMAQRQSQFDVRRQLQHKQIRLPKFPTTTIGSFPQTAEIRKVRRQYKQGQICATTYQQAMRDNIRNCIQQQEALELDVLVHGEAERNDMVEYFGEQLDGYAFSQFGWVQSYGSRCVKPPILFGDIQRPSAMTLEWTRFATTLTDKPMKGMLTGPVTILNWSFVRDDQSREQSCLQLALAIRDEVKELEQAGIKIIQIDEAALREGLPLKKSEWRNYLDWAIFAFKLSANGVQDKTQIHTHMCYSQFNDIIDAIAAMDADVITIETSRSDMQLLDVFDQFEYPNDIGPGVYDIHSPNIPSTQSIVELMRKAAQKIPPERLWINPDCGLKTRHWDDVRPALKNMVSAAKQLRQE